MEDLSPTHPYVPFSEALIEDDSFSPATHFGSNQMTPSLVKFDADGSTFVKSGVDFLTYAAAITVDVSLSSLHRVTTTSAVGNATIAASSAGVRGQVITFIIQNDGSGNRTITFGTNLSANATLVGTTNKKATISFISDGTMFYELCRTTGLT